MALASANCREQALNAQNPRRGYFECNRDFSTTIQKIGQISGRKIAFPLRSSDVVKAIKFLGFALLLLSSSFFWLLALRFLSLPFLIASWVLFVEVGDKDIRPSLAIWAFWLALTFSPIDVLPIPRRGPPRLVPLVMGLPRRETVERAKRGEVILGGCIVTGFEPKYFFVW